MPGGTFKYTAPPQSAPFCKVTLVVNGRRSVCDALLDSGAGLSTITGRALQELRPQKIGLTDPVSGATDINAKRYAIYRVHLHFLGFDYPNHPLAWLEHDKGYMLIGRDILNNHPLLLDGPRLEFVID